MRTKLEYNARAKDVLPDIDSMQAAVSMHSHHPFTPPAATEWTRLLPVFCSVRRRPYNALSMGVTQQFFVFVPGDPGL